MAMVVRCNLPPPGSSPGRNVIFAATAGPYLLWGVFNNDSLDQVFPCMFVGLVLFSVACLELLIAISSCPGAMFLLKSKLVEVWES